MTQHDRTDLPEYSRHLLGIRELRRWTQQQLAEQLFVSVRTIRDWEHGLTSPNLRDMQILRNMLKEAAETAALVASLSSIC